MRDSNVYNMMYAFTYMIVGTLSCAALPRAGWRGRTAQSPGAAVATNAATAARRLIFSREPAGGRGY